MNRFVLAGVLLIGTLFGAGATAWYAINMHHAAADADPLPTSVPTAIPTNTATSGASPTHGFSTATLGATATTAPTNTSLPTNTATSAATSTGVPTATSLPATATLGPPVPTCTPVPTVPPPPPVPTATSLPVATAVPPVCPVSCPPTPVADPWCSCKETGEVTTFPSEGPLVVNDVETDLQVRDPHCHRAVFHTETGIAKGKNYAVTIPRGWSVAFACTTCAVQATGATSQTEYKETPFIVIKGPWTGDVGMYEGGIHAVPSEWEPWLIHCILPIHEREVGHSVVPIFLP